MAFVDNDLDEEFAIRGGDEDEDNEAEYISTDANKKFTLFAIDGGESMFQRNEEGSCAFKEAVKCVLEIMLQMGCSGGTRYVGILVFNVESSLAHDKQLCFDWWSPVDEVRQDTVAMMNEFLNSDDYEEKFMERFKGHAQTHLGQLMLWASILIKEDSKWIGSSQKSLFIYTNNPDPFRRSTTHMRKTKTLMNDWTRRGARWNLEVLLMRPYDDERSEDEILTVWQSVAGENVRLINNIDELLESVFHKVFARRARVTVPFDLGNGVKLAISEFTLVSEAKKPSPKWKRGEDQVVARNVYVPKKQTKEEKEGGGDELMDTDTATRKPEGVKRNETAQQWSGGEATVRVDRGEIEAIRRSREPGLKLRCFAPIESIKIEKHVRASRFIYPAENQIAGSAKLYRALLLKCLERRKAMICEYVGRKGDGLSLVALVPEGDEQEGQAYHESGFHLVYLPYADNEREIPQEILEMAKGEATVAEKKVMKDFVKRLTGEFSPYDFTNPDLQAFYTVLINDVLGDSREPTDLIRPYFDDPEKAEKTHKRLEAIKDVFGLSNDNRAISSKRKGAVEGEGGQEKGKRVKKDVKDEESMDLKELAAKGKLKSMTVPQLKEAASLAGIGEASVLKSLKKADLISVMLIRRGMMAMAEVKPVIHVVSLDAMGTLVAPKEPPPQVYTRFARRHGIEVDVDRVASAFRKQFKELADERPCFGHSKGGPRKWWADLVSRTLMEADEKEVETRPTVEALNTLSHELFDFYATPGAWRLVDKDVKSWLARLRRKGIALAVISNFDSRLKGILDGMDVATLFNMIVLSGEVGVEKPNGRIFELVTSHFRLEDRTQLLHVGDDPKKDFEGAKAFGARAILFDPPRAEEIESVQQKREKMSDGEAATPSAVCTFRKPKKRPMGQRGRVEAPKAESSTDSEEEAGVDTVIKTGRPKRQRKNQNLMVQSTKKRIADEKPPSSSSDSSSSDNEPSALAGVEIAQAPLADFAFKASGQAAPLGPRDMGATKVSEVDTDYSRDAQAQFERVQKMLKEQAEKDAAAAAAAAESGKPVEEGPTLYKGLAMYGAKIKEDTARGNAKSGLVRLGPVRAPQFMRQTVRWDFAPDICKDYKETGFCTFGDSCKFMHDRSDYKHGWEIERDYQESLEKKEEEEVDYTIHEEEDDPLPEECPICNGPFQEPVVTKCKHYFCEACALKASKKSKKCQVCGTSTQGVFNPARELRAKLSGETKKRRKEAEEEEGKLSESESGEEEEEGGDDLEEDTKMEMLDEAQPAVKEEKEEEEAEGDEEKEKKPVCLLPGRQRRQRKENRGIHSHGAGCSHHH